VSIGAKVAVWTVTHGHAAHLEHGVGLEDLILDGLHALRLARHRGDVAHDELRGLGLARPGLTTVRGHTPSAPPSSATHAWEDEG
jgi:hypothetical protein